MTPQSRKRVLRRFAVGLCFALAACGETRHDSPNVVLLTLDTTRRDHLSVYGYERPTTPRLEGFAREGVVFDTAFCPIATTGPSHSSIFTSLYPVAHHVVKNGIRLDEELETLAEILTARGYQTAAVISSFVLTEKFGYAQGFAHFEDDFTLAGSSVRTQSWEGQQVEGGFDRRADDATRRAIRWLKEDRDADEPFFLFVHYFDPHSPYAPPPEFANRFTQGGARDFLTDAIGKYDEEIAFTDQQIGVLLDALDGMGLKDDTLVIVTADHGEGLGQHNHLEHGVNVYDEAVRVPLLARWPGHLTAGRVITEPVELVDLAPTILNLAGFPERTSFQGRSLARGLLGDEALDEKRPVFLHRRHYEPGLVGRTRVAGEKFAVRHEEWKLILGPEEGTHELFALDSDPHELRNLYDQEPARVAGLERMLETWKELVTHEGTGDLELSEADRAKLKALGYTE